MTTVAPDDSNMQDAADSSTAPVVTSYPIWVPKGHNKKFSIMKFNASLGIDFSNWIEPKLEREQNEVQLKDVKEELPKSGAGSEYGREAREEARRKRYRSNKKYKPEEQPWILEYGGEEGNKLRGVREGGVAEHTSYYMLTPGPNGSFNAFPVTEWYNFHRVQSYKALTCEEAEELNTRKKLFNPFNVMQQKRMKDEEEDDDDEDCDGKSKGKKKRPKGDSRHGDDIDEMTDSSEDGETSDDEFSDDGKKAKGRKKRRKAPTRERRVFEESDDDDGEGCREYDFTPSWETESQPEGDSDREIEDMEDDEDESRETDDQSSMMGNKSHKKAQKQKKRSNKGGKKSHKEDCGSSSSSDSATCSSVSEKKKAKPSPKPKIGKANSSRSATPKKVTVAAGASSSGRKRKGGAAAEETSSGQTSKKRCRNTSARSTAASSPATNLSANAENVNEASVRRYLERKSMTTAELLQKFVKKNTGLSENQLAQHIAQILKKMNLVKDNIKGETFLSLGDA